MTKGIIFFVSILVIVSAVVSFFTYKNLGVVENIDTSYRTYFFIAYDNYNAFIDSSLPNIVSNPIYYRGQYYKLRDYFMYDNDGNPYEFRVQFIPCAIDGVYLSDSPSFFAYTRDFEYSITENNDIKLYDIEARNLIVDYDLVFVFNRIRTTINDFNYDKQNYGDILDGEGNFVEYATERVKATFDMFNSLFNIIANGGVLEF